VFIIIRLKQKVREGIAGYVFAAPIILSVLLFTIYPVFSAIYYSFTDYQPTQSQKFNSMINLEEALMINLNVFPEEEEVNLKQLKENFSVEEFLMYDIGINLDDEQISTIVENLDKDRLLEDFVNGKLKAEISAVDFFKKYMISESENFTRYIPNFLGFDNFIEMFQDKYFWISLKNSFIFALIVVPSQTILAILLAVAANSKIRGRKFFKLVFFIPSITSAAAISMIFMLIYSKPGVLNRLLGTSVDWLNDPNTALIAVMIMNIWTTAGYFMVTFLAGLQNIPKSLYEASDIDGASFGQKLFKITIPLLKPQILFVSIMGVIGCMQVFDQIYFLIKNMRNITISFYIYKNAFEYQRMGYASSIAMILFLIILLLTGIQNKFFKSESYY